MKQGASIWSRSTGARGLFGLALGLCLAAAGADALSSMDADGDGRYSLAELRVHYPRLSLVTFDEIDVDNDGLVSPGEFRTGQDTGLLQIQVGG
jgi:hypothetical protein